MRVIGAPFNSSGRTDGVARAPRALREAGLIDRLPGLVLDAGNADVGALRPERDPRSGLRAVDSLHVTTASLRRAIAESLRGDERPLVIGGDCPVLLGCLRGAGDVVGEVGLLFVDGHEDAWPPACSTTGEAADCELGFALGLHRENLPPALTSLLPTLDPSAIVALGPRDAADLAAHAIPSLADKIVIRTAEDLSADADAPARLAAHAADRILRRVEHWWLHVDLDVLSSEALPAVDYLQPGGLSWPQLESLTGAALLAPGCLGITVCIYNPDLDPERVHAGRIVDYLGQICAQLAPLRMGPSAGS